MLRTRRLSSRRSKPPALPSPNDACGAKEVSIGCCHQIGRRRREISNPAISCCGRGGCRHGARSRRLCRRRMMPAVPKKFPLVVAITGASGVIYGIEMLRALKELGQETHLILSEAAGLNLSLETKHSIDDIKSLAPVVYSNK